MICNDRRLNVFFRDVDVEELGDKLEGGDVWVIETEANKKAIHYLFEQGRLFKLFGDITTFAPKGDNITLKVTNLLNTIFDHYYEYSINGNWSEIRLSGIKDYMDVRNKINEVGTLSLEISDDMAIIRRVDKYPPSG